MDVVKEDMQRVSVKEEDAEMEGDDLLWDQRKEESWMERECLYQISSQLIQYLTDNLQFEYDGECWSLGFTL